MHPKAQNRVPVKLHEGLSYTRNACSDRQRWHKEIFMEQIQQTLSDLMTITNKIQIFLKTAPKENLRTCKKGRNYQFYAEKNKKRTYIAKKNIQY